MKSQKTGDERLRLNGLNLDHKLIDFWRWSVSDLLSNATRGKLAEFIVATALDIDLSEIREEWAPYDLKTHDNIKVEVKSAAYIQSWQQSKHSKIIFSIKPTYGWDSMTNVYSNEIKRQSDVYVFCLLKHQDRESIDPMNLDQWLFFVAETKVLDTYPRSNVSITLQSLEKLTTAIGYSEIKEAVQCASIGGNEIGR